MRQTYLNKASAILDAMADGKDVGNRNACLAGENIN